MQLKLTVAIAALSLCAVSWAQSYDAVFRRNPWNDGKGVAGIRQDSVSVSLVEASTGYTEGNLRSSNDAAKAWTAGLRASSIKHFSKVSLYGALRFEQLWGRQMAGSMFVRPGFYPVDVYEFTAGDKSRQTYGLEGGLSVDVSDRWRLGLGLDLVAARSEKKTGLSHKTDMFDLTLKPGFQYHDGGTAFGLNLILSGNRETVRADKDVKAPANEVFINDGLYYGTRKEWAVYLPVSEFLYGLSAQFSSGGLYAGVQWRHRNGRIGYESVPMRMDGNDYGLDASYRLPFEYGVHTFRVSVSGYGEKDAVFSHSEFNTALGYDYSGRGWNAGLSLPISDREGTVVPVEAYQGSQSILVSALELHGGFQKGGFSAKASVKFGAGVLSDEMTKIKAWKEEQKPERLDSYFIKFSEHMTHPKLDFSPTLRYTFSGGFYLEGSVWWQHGFKMVYLGKDRVNAMFKLGYNF